MNRALLAAGCLTASILLGGPSPASADTPTRSIALWLGGRQAVADLPAVIDQTGEVYAPALDAVNGASGSTVELQPGHSQVTGAAADGQTIFLAVAATQAEAFARHAAYVVGDQTYVPLHALATQMGESFDWNEASGRVSLLPRLSSVSLAPGPHGARVELHSTAPFGFVRVSYYDSPWRLVLDVSGASTRAGRQFSTAPGISEIRWKEWPSAGHVRIVVQMSDEYHYSIADSGRPFDYWVDVDTGSVAGPEAGPANHGADDAVSDDTHSTAPAPNNRTSPDRTRPVVRPLPASDPAAPKPGGVLAPAPVNVIPVISPTPTLPPGSTTPPVLPNVDIKGVQSRRLDPHTVEVTISAAGPIDCKPTFCDSPDRLVLDIPNSTLKLLTPEMPIGGPGVTKVRTGAFPLGTGNSRIVLDLTSRSSYRVWSAQDRSLIRVLVREMQATPRNAGGSPVAGHTVCIDAGHCGVYTGARGLFGLKEEEVTLDVARRLEQLLTAAGAQVIMTRENMDPPSGQHAGLLADLVERAQIANRNRAELFLSIHCDAMPDGLHGHGNGSQVIYGHERSYRWGTRVYKAITGTLGHGGTGLHYRPQVKVTEYTEMPAVLAELGFLDTRADAEKLIDNDFRQREAEGLFAAFEDYFSGNNGGGDLLPPPGGTVIPVPVQISPPGDVVAATHAHPSTEPASIHAQ